MESVQTIAGAGGGPCPRRLVWLLIVVATLLAGGTFSINCWRLATFRYAGPLDLAYYNQQLWNAWHGHAPITVRPRNSYVTEGPQPWRTNHLRPITLPIGLLYGIWPGTVALYAVQSLILGCGVWPACRIGQRIGGDTRCGVVTGCLYAASPIVWLLGTNDFRYLHLGIPCVLGVIDAMERRAARQTVLWLLLLFSTRESYCIVVAALGLRQLLRRDRPFRENLYWAGAAVAIGAMWFWVHVGWLCGAFGGDAAAGYLRATRDPVAAYGRNPGVMIETLRRSGPQAAVVAGPLAVLGIVAPEFALPGLALGYPPLQMGLFTLHPAQHYTRYLAPAGTMLLAAALVGFARIWRCCGQGSRTLWTLVSVGGFVASVALTVAFGPHPVLKLPSRLGDEAAARRFSQLLDEIPSRDGVLAFRAILPPLASRTALFDYYQLPPDVTVDEALRRSRWVLLEPHVRLLGAMSGSDLSPAVLAQAEYLAVTQSDGGSSGAELLRVARRLNELLRPDEFEVLAQSERVLVFRRRAR